MSIQISSALWRDNPPDRMDRLVLLAPADFADDAGHCWPSIATIAARARMTARGAQKVVRRLEADGWLEVVIGGGRHGCNRYRVLVGTTISAPPQPAGRTPNAVHPECRSP